MKKVLMVVLCLYFLFSFSEFGSAQQTPQKGIQTDSTRMKQNIPATRKQKAQVKKTGNETIDLHNLKLWKDDRPLLMKEKDSLQKKVQ